MAKLNILYTYLKKKENGVYNPMRFYGMPIVLLREFNLSQIDHTSVACSLVSDLLSGI